MARKASATPAQAGTTEAAKGEAVQPAPALNEDARGDVGGGSDADDSESDERVRLVVTGPKKGRRRAGFHFGSEPRSLVPGDLGEPVEGAGRLLAILTDPALSSAFHFPDGRVEPVGDDKVEAVREALEAVRTAADPEKAEAARGLAALMGMSDDA